MKGSKNETIQVVFKLVNGFIPTCGGANAATTVNVGGYVPTADSPVVGGIGSVCDRYGYVNGTTCTAYFGTLCLSYNQVYSCVASHSVSFGLNGSDGGCPDNTVGMTITNYIRPDTGSAFTGKLCVKTDTYQ